MDNVRSQASQDNLAVQFENVCLDVRNGKALERILHGVTGSVKRGTVITLVGPSGAGKSTVLSLCNLLRTATEGKVTVFGRDVLNWDISLLRQKAGLVFQTPTMFPGTVLENVEMGPGLRGEKVDNPEALLASVGLSSALLGQSAKELSGGQKQRVALARVLANKPELLLLDEVTSALDRKSAREVEETILGIQREKQTTLLWVTHNLAQARRVGDETWLMVDGKIVEAASTEKFFTEPEREETRTFLSDDGLGGDEE